MAIDDLEAPRAASVPGPDEDRARLREAAAQWQTARRARARTVRGSHDWANAEVAVRFWSLEFRELRALARTSSEQTPG